MSKPVETTLQCSKTKTKGKGPYFKYSVRIPIKWVKKLGLEKGSPLKLELLEPEGILIKKASG